MSARRPRGHTGRPGWPALLVAWFEAHLRPMPWRDRPTPYRVWISEIMLQQTQVATVSPYFARFIQRFPDPATLAAAPLSDVLRLWEGLGYYSRARNLHRAAGLLMAADNAKSGLAVPPSGTSPEEKEQTQIVPEEQVAGDHNRLPHRAADWVRLPGVGPYTAAAIASICHDEPVPVVDGNVARVFARFLALTDDIRTPGVRRRIEAFLAPVIAGVPAPGRFNQAMMELGALVCRPRRPACRACPLSGECEAFRQSRQGELPVRMARKPLETRHAVALYLTRRNRCLLLRHQHRRLLGGLWELPGGDYDPATEMPDAAVTRLVHELTGLRLHALQSHGRLRHGFTHFKLDLALFAANAQGTLRASAGGDALQWTTAADAAASPMSRLHRKALDHVRRVSADGSGCRLSSADRMASTQASRLS